MKRGAVSILITALLLGFWPRANAATDSFLQISTPIVTNGQVQFTLIGESGVSYVIESSTNAQSWSPVLTNLDYLITRTISLPATDNPVFCRAWRYPLPRFAGAITTKQFVDFHGNNVHFDSFDSADPAKSTNGQYDPTKAQPNGDIASEAGLISVNNLFMNGKLKLGFNVGYSLGATGYVGPIGWTGPGIYSPDWVQTDFRFVAPNVSRPFATGFPLPSGAGTNYTILGSANYYVSGNLRPTGSSKTILVTGNANLYVNGDFVLPANWPINIQPGAALRVYVGALEGSATSAAWGSVQFAVGSDVSTFQFYGLPTTTDVAWNGNDAYIGIVYAPQATFTVGGGGNTVFDYQGAVVAHWVGLNGHFNFHYDENLKKKGPQR